MHPELDQDCTEIRLIRSLSELNFRLLRTPDPTLRTQLRETMVVLREQLIKLVENFPIYSESAVNEAQTASPLRPIGLSSRHC